MIYLDNAATTKLDKDAFEIMQKILLEEYANPSQNYSFSRKVKTLLQNARATISKCINAEPEEIYFTSGGTESDNWAIKGIIEYGDNRAIVTSEIEHHAILKACERIETLGYPVAYIKPKECGTITPLMLDDVITNPKLVSVMMLNNEIGVIEPIKELAKIAHNKNSLFHTDAVQAMGHIPIDVKELEVDMLSASAHKFNGPRGVGFLYIKNGTKVSPFINGGKQENGMRAGTENVAAICAMAVALEKNCNTMRNNITHIKKLESEFLNTLNVDYQVNGSKANKYSGICSISFKGVNAESLYHILDLKGIFVSTGSACNSKSTEISHVLKAINLKDDVAKSTIRISFGKDNTIKEVTSVAKHINDLVKKLRC